MRFQAGAILLAIALVACGHEAREAPTPQAQQATFVADSAVLYRVDASGRTALLALDSAHASAGVAVAPAEWTPAAGSTFGVAAKTFRHIAGSPRGDWVAWETAGAVHDLLGLIPARGGNIVVLDFYFDSSAQDLSWAPGGRYLAARYNPPSGYEELRVYDASAGRALSTPWSKECRPDNECRVVTAQWSGASTLSVKTSAREYKTDVSRL